MAGIRRHLLALFLLGTGLALGRFLWRYFLFGASRSIERSLRDDMFAHLETLDVEYYNEHKTGDQSTWIKSTMNRKNRIRRAIVKWYLKLKIRIII